MKNVLIVASTFSHIRNFHLPYIKKFKEMGWQVDVSCGGEIDAKTEADNVFLMPLEKKYISKANIKACIQLRRTVRKNKYDLIIMHTSLAAFYARAALLGMLRRPRTINMVHGYLFDDKGGGKLKKAAEIFLSPVTDKVITMNRYDYDWAKKHRAGKETAMVPGVGVDAEKVRLGEKIEIDGITAVDTVLVFPAEFSERKNQSMLIRAMALLPGNIKLILPGDGAMRDACVALAKKLDVADRVFFPGYVKHMESIYRMAHVAVTSSRFEGLPFNVMEAMLYSLPVIASKVKGNEDLVEEGVTGRLFEYDDAEGFAAAVRELTDNKDTGRAMGYAGRQKIEEYTLSNVLEKVMQEYLQ